MEKDGAGDYRGLYRAALAMNNMGVSLLERRASREAMETLKDAVNVLNGLFQIPQEQHNLTCIDDMLHRAYSRVSQSRSRSDNSFGCIRAIPHDADFVTVVPALLESATLLQGVNCVIKVESFDSDDRNIDIDCAILLHNFAIAHLATSKTISNPMSAGRLRFGACKLAGIAHATLSNFMMLHHQMGHGEILLECPTLPLATAVILHGLIQIHTERGALPMAAEPLEQLTILGNIAVDLDEPSTFYTLPAGAA
jgi:hypothetical protein